MTWHEACSKEDMAVDKTGPVSRGRKAMVFALSMVFFLSVFSLFYSAAASPLKRVDVYDPFEVIDEVRRLESRSLWPGFEPKDIPLGIFDGERTYLVGFPKPPAGFVPVDGRPDVLIFDGQHPSMFGNTCVRLNGVWLASIIPVRRSEFTGRNISLTEAAAVVIHEKFHVFEAVRHPEWKPNDGVLLSYPLDTRDSLTQRNQELEALRLAVRYFAPGDIGWAKTAFFLRAQRTAGLNAALVQYEREIRRLEGLAEYVEYKAAGKPEAEGRLPLGFAPKAIREMGYAAGRWTAILLDRFDPGWEDEIEAGKIEFPEDRLEDILRGRNIYANFSDAQKAAWSIEVRTALAAKAAEQKKILEDMNSILGITVVINARRRPLHVEAFEPYFIEAAGPRLLFHKRRLSLRNENGEVHVFGPSVLTETDERGRVIKVVIPGLSKRIPSVRARMTLKYQSDGLALSLKSYRLRTRGAYGFLIDLR